MNSAFVVEYSPRDENKIFDVRVQQTPVYDDKQTNIRYDTNGCSFIVQNTNFSRTGTGTIYCYSQKNVHQAEFMEYLLRMVQKFQLFCLVYDVFDNIDKEDNRCNMIDKMKPKHTEILNYLSSIDSYYCYPQDYIPGGNCPIKIHELNTTKDVKPCFFVREYKISDKRVSLHLYIMLEKNNNDQTDGGLFNFNVKFVGSNKPLQKWFSQIPILDAKQIYKQRHDEYIEANQLWLDKICNLISSESFSTRLQTYSRKEETWDCAWSGSEPYNQCEFYVQKTKRCSNPICMGNCFGTRTVTYDGSKMYESFCNVFGKDIGILVKKGQFTQDKRHLIPDFSDKKFICCFNEFCKIYGLYDYRIDNIFDSNNHMTNGVQYIENVINRLNTWGRNPYSNMVPYLSNKTIFHIPTTPGLAIMRGRQTHQL